MEAESSSPEPTPADMRLGTQGIDLGSGDTSGSDAPDGEPDSELADFVVGSDQPIEFASSSMPMPVSARRASRVNLFVSQESVASRVTEDDLPDVSTVLGRGKGTNGGRREVVLDEDSDASDDAPVRRRKRRKVIDEDSDE